MRTRWAYAAMAVGLAQLAAVGRAFGPVECPPNTTLKHVCMPCGDAPGCTVISKSNATTPAACCAACAATKGCAVWTLNSAETAESPQQPCHLKTAATTATKKGGSCVTGIMGGPPPGPAPPAPPAPPKPKPNGKPNILFLMCDSMDGRVLDPTSDVSQRVEMPNLRKLASQGVNFVRTYAASPQCVPSRATMFAGRRIDQIKTWNNDQGLAAAPDGSLDASCVKQYDSDHCTSLGKEQAVQSTLTGSLKELGCMSCMFGKVDVGARIIEDDNNGTGVPCTYGSPSGFHGGAATNTIGRSADIWKPTKPQPISITSDTDNNVHPEDQKMIRLCGEWFETHDAKADPYSWFHYCSINIPHPAFNTNATWLAKVNDDKVQVPSWLPQEQFHPADRYMSISKNVWNPEVPDADIVKVRKTYYAMCAETDWMLGEVMEAANRTGHLANTYIVFVSDHGEMNMEHRQVWKNSMYEASSRVPMIISGPGLARNVVIRNLTSLLDIYPTLVAMQGGTPPSYLAGFSLIPFLQPDGGRDLKGRGKHGHSAVSASGAPPRHDYVTSQYHSNMGNTGSFMIRQGQWKYIAFGQNGHRFNGSCGADCTYPPQLFDVDADPEELKDVAESQPDVAERLDALLRSQVDYPAVDLECKRYDKLMYYQFLAAKTNGSAMGQHWKQAYKGFDCGASNCGKDTGTAATGDWLKVQQWLADPM